MHPSIYKCPFPEPLTPGKVGRGPPLPAHLVPPISEAPPAPEPHRDLAVLPASRHSRARRASWAPPYGVICDLRQPVRPRHQLPSCSIAGAPPRQPHHRRCTPRWAPKISPTSLPSARPRLPRVSRTSLGLELAPKDDTAQPSGQPISPLAQTLGRPARRNRRTLQGGTCLPSTTTCRLPGNMQRCSRRRAHPARAC